MIEHIKFAKKVTMSIPRTQTIAGNCIYYALANGNRAKVYCYSMGVTVEVINHKEGKVDSVNFPFSNYFEAVQCSPGAPKWYQHIDGGKWRFEGTYSHVLPKKTDYRRLADAIDNYIMMFE